jgi:acyl-coenzyme A thioesterase 9
MVFGGYLLKQTFELAFTCAAAFSHARPRFLNLDPSTFEEPVPVGSVLYVSAGVSYTEPDPNGGTRIQVMVRTHVRPVEHQSAKSTGTFYYTFLSSNDISVLPQSYSDFMRWVAGKRRAERLAATLETDSSTVLGSLHAGNMTE